MQRKLRTVLRDAALCLLVLAIAVVAADQVRRFEQRRDQAHFQHESLRLQAQLRDRLLAYEQVLSAGASFLAVSEAVGREDWQRFMRGFDIPRQFPGLDAVAYADWLPAHAVAAYVARQRAATPDFTVWPSGSGAQSAIVRLIAPVDEARRRVFGYDLYTSPLRAEAMQRARDEGRAVMSGRVVLASALPGDRTPSVLLFVPVYAGGAVPPTVTERRSSLVGFVYAAIRMPDLIGGLSDVRTPGLHLYLTEGDGTKLHGDAPPEQVVFRETQDFEVYGRVWTFGLAADRHVGPHRRSAAPYVFGGVLLLSLMLWWVRRTSGQSEARAQVLARQMTEALRASEAAHRAIVESSIEGILTIDPHGTVLSFNRAAERMFGYRADEVIGRNVSMLMPERFRARHDALVANFQRGGSRNIVGLRREVIGLRRDGEEFPMSLAISVVEDESPVQRLVGVIADITESKRQEQRIRRLADHDALTQLPNRSLLQDRLDVAITQAARERRMIGVMMIDLDQFKRINDSLGHEIGDRVLLMVAARLCSRVRDCDTVARMGGDEFVVLVDGVTDGDAIARIAGSILAAFETPMLIDGHELHVGASVGVSCYPNDGDDVATLLRNADAAMYDAKASGRGHYRMFSAEMMRRARHKLELEGAIRKALAGGQFVMHYEPLMCLRTGDLLGAEALIRWQHPERGMISPAEFIPVAEETGQIVAIGEWTLRSACAEARQIQLRLGQPLSVSVNLSPRQFARPDIAAMVESACADGGLDPQFLVLEITEGTLLKPSEQILNTLDRLRALGVRVAVDDFGTGYSSLAYITRFPIDLLKIDGSFVRDLIDDPADAAIVNAIIAMAHSLGIGVVAEGVETAEQLAVLRERGCDAAQGYFFGRGAPAAQFAAQRQDFSQSRTAPQPARLIAAVDADALF
ncbi:bifunctional diguanylate cyclase/phosphodiesterase [Sinimarinibacterium thermocellulolyticum]|uniref:EAL domain-containing protein n=1 Tax=Sinimarinibacterium thermocellulolyticum TaxID=3170016 RepID=A0ABV2A600_9GAMM